MTQRRASFVDLLRPTADGAKVAIFDLDGTLIDSAQTIHKIINDIRAHRGFSALDSDLIRPHLSKGGESLVRLCLDQASRDSKEDLSEFRSRYLAIGQGPEILYQEVLKTLDELTLLGWKLGVCTNKPRHLTHAALTQTGLHAYFRAVVAGGDGFPAKPDPTPLVACCRMLSVAPQQAVFVGDSEVDEQTAASAECPFVLVDHGYPVNCLSTIPCIARVSTFADLLPVLARAARTRARSAGCRSTIESWL